MPQPLVKTKLHIPRLRPELVPRPRLIERLKTGLSCPLTLISAPAGFGKTTLISNLKSLPNFKLAWVSLDEDDNDPARFLTYLTAAVEKLQAGLGTDAQTLLQAASPLPVKPVVTALINALSDLDDDAVLVLDDYHLITSAAVHEVSVYLLDHLPPTAHLVIASRIDPPLPLARLRVRCQMTEIRAADLRFTPDEAAAFLNTVMKLGLSAEHITALEERTEGWIAGLQLAALAMTRREADVAGFVERFSGSQHMVLDYLTDEVLSHQSETIQHFLLQTSIFERFCPALCDAVTSLPLPGMGQAMLEQLEHANLFVIPLDDECCWYRYHHLFRDLLRTRLNETQADVAALHRRASVWYAQNDLMAEAIHHALAAHDIEAAADLIERVTQDASLWARGDMVTLREWTNVLPPDMIRARPRLGLYVSWTQYLTGQLAAAEHTLDEAEQALNHMPAQADGDELKGIIASTHARYGWVRGQPHAALDFAHAAYAHLPESAVLFRARTAYAEGGVLADLGRTSEAAYAFRRSVEMAERVGANYLALGAAGLLIEQQILLGQLSQAERTCKQVDRLGTVGDVRVPAANAVAENWSRIYYERNDLPAAERLALESIELLEQGGLSDQLGYKRMWLAQIRLAQGQVSSAREATEQALALAQRSNARSLGLAQAWQARIWLADGQVELAARWADDYRRLTPPEYLREFEDLTLVRVLLATGRLSEALALLENLLVSAELAGRVMCVIEILCLRAIVLHTSNKTTLALDDVSRALALAEPEGYVRVFLDIGKPLQLLIARMLASDDFRLKIEKPVRDYADKLLKAFGNKSLPDSLRAEISHPEHLHRTPSGAQVSEIKNPKAEMVEPLSDRELEVLRLLAEGLSNREIAERLYLSPNTLKAHTTNIYGKLDAHSRMQAVNRARELGLLPPA